MLWYLEAFKKYADFSGRARRKEYWTFVICNIIITSLLGAVGREIDMLFIPGIFSLIIFIPSLAVLIRRLHDVGKGGGFILIGIIPLVGQVLMFLQLIKEGNKKDNKFGPNPKRG